MHVSFDQIWDVVKWVTLIVIWPSARFIWNHLTGRRKRRLDAVDELLRRSEAQAMDIMRLTETITELRAQVADLTHENHLMRLELVRIKDS